MLVELVFLFLVAVAGRLCLARDEVDDVDPSGLIVGTALYVTCVAVVLITGLPGSPAAAIVMAVAVGFGVAIACRRNDKDDGPARPAVTFRPRRRTVLAVGAVVATGAVFHSLRLVRDATDAWAHLNIGARLRDGTLILADVSVKRGLSFGAIEAIGPLAGDVAVMGIVPAFGVAALLSAYAIVRLADVSGAAARALALIAVAVLATNARFLTNLVLIGPHLVVAFWLLAMIAVLAGRLGRLEGRGHRRAVARWIVLGALALAVVAARGEGALLVVPAAVPFLTSFRGAPARPADVRSVALGLLLWVVPYHTDRFAVVPGMEGALTIALGLMLLLATAAPVRRLLERIPLVGVTLGLSWIAMLAFLIVEPDEMLRLLVSTFANVALDVGGWGVGLLLILALAVVVRAVSGEPLPHRTGLLLGTFLPSHLILGILTGEGYAIGEGSSLNRMIFHVYPVLVVSVAAAILRMFREEQDAPWPEQTEASR